MYFLDSVVVRWVSGGRGYPAAPDRYTCPVVPVRSHQITLFALPLIIRSVAGMRIAVQQHLYNG